MKRKLSRVVVSDRAGFWVEIDMDGEDIEELRAAHEALKPNILGPNHPMTVIYNFIEQVVYGDAAELIENPAPLPPAS